VPFEMLAECVLIKWSKLISRGMTSRFSDTYSLVSCTLCLDHNSIATQTQTTLNFPCHLTIAQRNLNKYIHVTQVINTLWFNHTIS